ncbi:MULTISPECIES: cobalamin-independent methionine synthase II family protein [unclassified Agrococcus]|uniref:cobalamin-independent methionine synthase II family protein n=1 Tax=unclassified Agrococcus TaxID=2615065 RepID=UPI00361FBBB6
MTEILTTHAGSLPRTPALLAANAARTVSADGFTLERTAEHDALVTAAVADVVVRQRDAGIRIVGDGEYGKAMSTAVDYGAWWSYAFQRVAGLALTDDDVYRSGHVASEPGRIRLTSFPHRRDRVGFPGAYSDPDGVLAGRRAVRFPATTGPLSYVGQDAVASDARALRSAIDAAGVEEGFLTALSPGSGARVADEHYGTDEEHVWAWADVLREEYLAIVDAGLTVQVDDPSLAESWDQISPEPTVADYRAWLQVRIDALRHALRGIPPERVRLHVCWGSWHGPHVTDLGLEHIVDQVLQVGAGAISFEAANVRHEHEWRVWQGVDLPEHVRLLPGVVSHATNVVEHPRLVADRIERWASIVGPERVVASTDCGLGGRVHPEIAWAKLAALGEGAALARP